MTETQVASLVRRGSDCPRRSSSSLKPRPEWLPGSPSVGAWGSLQSQLPDVGVYVEIRIGSVSRRLSFNVEPCSVVRSRLVMLGCWPVCDVPPFSGLFITISARQRRCAVGVLGLAIVVLYQSRAKTSKRARRPGPSSIRPLSFFVTRHPHSQLGQPRQKHNPQSTQRRTPTTFLTTDDT